MKWIHKRLLRKMLGPISDHEHNVAAEYYYQVMMSKESGEQAISYLMDFYILPYKPIVNDMDTFKQLDIDVTFVYGDKDWLDTGKLLLLFSLNFACRL